MRNIGSDEGLAGEVKALGQRALRLQMDMTSMEEISRAIADTVSTFGRLDILVNNAGIAPGNLAEDVREEDYDVTMAVNVKGTFFASQAAGRQIIRQKSRRAAALSTSRPRRDLWLCRLNLYIALRKLRLCT